VVAITRWLVKRDIAAALSETAKASSAGVDRNRLASASAETIKVVVRVEKGRVSRAFVEEHRPGMEAYEALALRIARGRRYSRTTSGEETVSVRINSPD
jgi:hypothetical protein